MVIGFPWRQTARSFLNPITLTTLHLLLSQEMEWFSWVLLSLIGVLFSRYERNFSLCTEGGKQIFSIPIERMLIFLQTFGIIAFHRYCLWPLLACSGMLEPWLSLTGSFSVLESVGLFSSLQTCDFHYGLWSNFRPCWINNRTKLWISKI